MKSCQRNKKSLERGSCTCSGRDCKRVRCGFDALFRIRYFRYFQRSVCIFFGTSPAYAWHRNIFVPGVSGFQPDAYAKALCTTVFIQLCCRLCIWGVVGCPRIVDQYSAEHLWLAYHLFYHKLSFDKSWDCAFQSLLSTHYSDRSVSKGTFSNHWHRLFQNQDRI